MTTPTSELMKTSQLWRIADALAQVNALHLIFELSPATLALIVAYAETKSLLKRVGEFIAGQND